MTNETDVGGFGLSMFPFTAKTYCCDPLGNPVCPTDVGRAKIMARPGYHNEIAAAVIPVVKLVHYIFIQTRPTSRNGMDFCWNLTTLHFAPGKISLSWMHQKLRFILNSHSQCRWVCYHVSWQHTTWVAWFCSQTKALKALFTTKTLVRNGPLIERVPQWLSPD